MADDDIFQLGPDNDPNLKNLYHALQYSPSGYPELRVASRISAASLGNLNVIYVLTGSKRLLEAITNVIAYADKAFTIKA